MIYMKEIKENKEPKKGYFGDYGGQFIPPQLKNYMDELEKAYNEIKDSPKFRDELNNLLKDYVGRPSPLYLAQKLSNIVGCKVYLKREDLNHTGAHKINNTIGQGLLAKHMGKTELIAETGAGQHGVATATVAALLGMKCRIFMGEIDVEKQMMNVYRMQLLGAEVVVVKTGGRTLKDAVDEALGYLISHPDVFYLLGSVVGPHPYPTIVRDFQKIIGEEAKQQILEKEGRLPDYLVACVGGGSNAMGLFYDFLGDQKVKLVAVEPAGKGLETGKHAATLSFGTPGIIHGFRCLLLQDAKGEPAEVYSIASGLDYPGVGPEHCMLKDSRRLEIAAATDKEALGAFDLLSREEGIIPALESSHAIAYLLNPKTKQRFRKEDIVIVNLSGRGDKDVETVSRIKQG
jgi:tryptophan synthase beta chain